MALTLAITGKGGVGKSTLAGTLARLLAADGRHVLAIDADPDANLASALGLPPDLRRSVRTIGEERQLIEERTGAKAREFGQIFRLNPDVRGIAEQYGTHFAGTDLVVLGAAGRPGGGCACPEAVLLQSLIRHLVLTPRDVVLLDMEAGIEHLGRGTAAGMGAMLAVVEPGQRSLDTAVRIREMAAALGIRRFGVVLNKATAVAEDRRWVGETLGPESVLAAIPFDARIAEADRRGVSLVDLGSEELLQPFRELQRILEERFEGAAGGHR
jgi:CO dehydrogenase maturation factor